MIFSSQKFKRSLRRVQEMNGPVLLTIAALLLLGLIMQ